MTTNNNLIADFMNSKVSENNYFINGMYKEVNNLKYDSEWNWLMEVVEKIQLNSKKFGTVTLHGLGRTKIDCYDNEQISNRIDVLDQKYGIAPTYKACIEFIKWYNKQ